jgi:hypothetical protein
MTVSVADAAPVPEINRKQYVAAMVALGRDPERAEMDFEYDVSRRKIVEAACCRS